MPVLVAVLIAQLLSHFRETLLGQLNVYIKQLRDDFVQRTGGSKAPPKGKNLPEMVNNVVYVRQLEAKVCVITYASELGLFQSMFPFSLLHTMVQHYFHG